MLRVELLNYLNTLLTPEKYQDYAPNGLQVEGSPEVRRIVTGVTASQCLIETAIREQADTILVHHGWFWKHEDPRILGVKRLRMGSILKANINLIAYHLPLDDHPTLGNNTLFGQMLGFDTQSRFGEEGLGHLGFVSSGGPDCLPTDPNTLSERLARALDRAPLCVGPINKCIKRVAWCTGAAQDMIEEAQAAGADCFISGEISERTTHLARELGITYFACGHHATERCGIEALGAHLAEKLGLQVLFADIPNPV